MGILSRFRDVMASNVNALLEKAEEPAKVIDTYMRGLYQDLGQVKAETEAVLADQQRAQRALNECNDEINKLQRYAEKSIEARDEEAARKFLERKAMQAGKQTELQSKYDTAASNADHMKQMQEKLESDIRNLETKRIELKDKMAATEAQQKINAMTSSQTGLERDSAFGIAEEKVNHAYLEAMALAELRKEAKGEDLDELFAQLEREAGQQQEKPDISVDDEMAAIKAKLKEKE